MAHRHKGLLALETLLYKGWRKTS